MKSSFEGQAGNRLLHQALLGQKIVGGHAELAKELAAAGALMEVKAGATLIQQGAEEDDLFLILSGSFNVAVNGKHAAVCGPGDHVGEMSPMQTMKRRTATVVAAEDSVVLRLTAEHMANMGRNILRCGATWPRNWRADWTAAIPKSRNSAPPAASSSWRPRLPWTWRAPWKSR